MKKSDRLGRVVQGGCDEEILMNKDEVIEADTGTECTEVSGEKEDGAAGRLGDAGAGEKIGCASADGDGDAGAGAKADGGAGAGAAKKTGGGGAAKTISFIMIITMLGKLLGLYRNRLLAVTCGTGMLANAFSTASRIPRVFFDVLFASAISASFIPIYTEYREKKGKDEAQRFAGNFITVIGAVTLVLSVAGVLFSDQLVTLFAPEYNEATAALCSDLTKIMIPTLFFTGIAYSFVGILQAEGEFNVPALISVVSNLIIIIYYLFLFDYFGVYGLSVAFLIGWGMQAVVQIPSLRKKDYKFRFSMDLKNEGIHKVMKLMIPVMVSTWVQPIILMINSRYASSLYDGGGVTMLDLANDMYLIIAGVFVLSVTNVIFPKLAKQSASDDASGFISTVRSSTQISLFFIIPMMAGLMALSREVIDLIYGGGEFGASDISLTSEAMFFISLGMVGYALQNILCRVYYARQDGRTPLVAGVISIVVNIISAKLLVGPMSIAGLGLASAISSTVYAVVLLVPLQRGKNAAANAKGIHVSSNAKPDKNGKRHESGMADDVQNGAGEMSADDVQNGAGEMAADDVQNGAGEMAADDAQNGAGGHTQRVKIIDKKMAIDLLKVCISSVIMYAGVRLCAKLLTGVLSGIAGKVLVLAVPTIVGIVIFFVMVYVLRAEEIKYVKRG